TLLRVVLRTWFADRPGGSAHRCASVVRRSVRSPRIGPNQSAKVQLAKSPNQLALTLHLILSSHPARYRPPQNHQTKSPVEVARRWPVALQNPTPDRVLQHVRPPPKLTLGDRRPRPQPILVQLALKPRRSTRWSCRCHLWCWQSRFFSWFRPYSGIPQKYCKHTGELPNKYKTITAKIPQSENLPHRKSLGRLGRFRVFTAYNSGTAGRF